MPALTSIEATPPGFGWGDHDADPVHHRFLKERLETEKNEDAGLYKTTSELCLAKGDETPMEKLVRESMPYDDGFDLDFVDKLVYGGPAYVDQDGVGSCVGAGGASAVATKAAVELLLEGDPENPFGMDVQQYDTSTNACVPVVDYSYGAGKMKSYWDGSKFTRETRIGDGSYCGVQIWAFKTVGVLPAAKATGCDGCVFPQTKQIRSNAGNRGQFLNRHLDAGMQHRMGDSTRVNSFDDLKRVICELKQPCMICSGWGFRASNQVDGLGWVYRRGGSWPHNMTICACVEVKGEWYVKVRNQWGSNAHKDGWHFWVGSDTMSSWLRSAECQSIGELSLIPSEAIPDFPF